MAWNPSVNTHKEPQYSLVLALSSEMESGLELLQSRSLEHKDVSSMRAEMFCFFFLVILFNDASLLP